MIRPAPRLGGIRAYDGRIERAVGGAWVKGRLWLRRAAAFDTSSIAADRELAAEADRAPLYGAVIIDLGAGTPVLTGGGREPDPRSFDPHWPGVLVVRRADTTQGAVTWRILVATTANDRRIPCQLGAACPPLPSEGPGVVLTVEKLTADSFAGEWRPAAQGPASGDTSARPGSGTTPILCAAISPERPHLR